MCYAIFAEQIIGMTLNLYPTDLFLALIDVCMGHLPITSKLFILRKDMQFEVFIWHSYDYCFLYN